VVLHECGIIGCEEYEFLLHISGFHIEEVGTADGQFGADLAEPPVCVGVLELDLIPVLILMVGGSLQE
jgi:hypothetical protein